VLFWQGPEQRTLPARCQRPSAEHLTDHHRGGGDPDDAVIIMLAYHGRLAPRNERVKGNNA